MRRALKWIKRFLIALFALIAFVLVTTLIVLHTDWGRAKALSITLDKLQKLFPGGISAKQLTGSVLGEIELVDVTIGAFDKHPMIHAKKVRANLKISSLFSKKIELEYAILDDADVKDPSNPVLLVEDNEPPFGWDVVLDDIQIHRANIVLSGDKPMTFQNVEVAASLHVIGGGGGLLAAAKANGTWRENGFPFAVEAEAAIGEAVKVTKLDAKLGETTVKGTNITIDADRSTGNFVIHATPDVVASFAPKVALPAPAEITIDITRPGAESRIELGATMGAASLQAAFVGDATTRKARGMIAANGIDISRFVPRLTGTGDGVVAVVTEGKDVRATAIVRGQLLDLPAGHAVVGVNASLEGVRGVLVAGGDGGLGTAAVGTLKIAEKKVDLVDARVITRVRNASVVTNKKVPFKGPITVGGNARGTIAPVLKIDIDGDLSGNGLVATDAKIGLGIGSVTGHVDASITEKGTWSHVHVTAKNVSKGGAPIGTFEVDARNMTGGKILANVKAFPAAIQAVAEIDATVDLGTADTDPIRIELGKHSVRAGRVNWGGEGGTITLSDEQVLVKDIKSASGAATLAIDATVHKPTGTVEIKAKALQLPIATFDPAYAGKITADVDMKRRGIVWNGKVAIDAHGVTLGPNVPSIEGNVALTVANRHITADIKADTFQVGGVRVVVDVDGPTDITDALAWRRLDRKAIRTALVGITRIDLGALKVKTGGTIDGEIVLAGMDASGTLNIKAIQTKVGPIDGTINFAPVGDDLGVSSTFHIADIGDAQAAAQIAIPMYPFEPNEWKKLGRGVIRTLTATVEDVIVNPEKLAKLGITTPYKARVSAGVVLAAGAGQAKATLDIREVSGGKLLAPVDVHVEAGMSPTNTNASVEVRASKKAEWGPDDKRLARVSATLPKFNFDSWIADPKLVTTTPLEGALEFPDVDIPEVLAMFGRADITSGKLAGVVKVVGTPSQPTADGELVISNVNVKPRLSGRKLPTLDELRIKPKWDGTTASVDIKGKESDKATLDIVASARPTDLAAATARIIIKKFDVAPVAVFLPGPAVAATGKVSADITVTGIKKVRGTFNLEKGRVPIHPQVGTLRDANLDIKLSDLGLDYKVSAKLGAGTIKIDGDAPPDLSNVTVRGSLDKISPIGEIQPVASAKIAGTIFRGVDGIRAELKLRDTNVTLDMEQGVKLLESEMPEDLFIGRSTAPPPVPKQSRLPRKPWFTITAFVESTPVFVKHEYFELRARVAAKRGITLKIGRTFGMDGSIEIERGDIDIVGRHYRVEPNPNAVRFDGTPDPLLAIRLVHDFPEITLTADIGGRASKRSIRMSDEPHRFTEDELFAFFAGGDPGGDSGTATRDAAQNAAAAVLSAKIGRRAKKVLPIKVDVIACDAGSSNSGVSCKAGKWITENWFVAFKQRLEPRPDEEPSEVNAQYYFKRNWIFEAAGFAERYGGDILWRKRW